MPVKRVEPGATVGASRGETVVCVRADAPRERSLECLRSVLASTPTDVKVLIYDAAPDRLAQDLVRELERAGAIEHELFHADLAAAAPADVITLSSGCVVPSGWVARLRDAAWLDSTVATATPLSDTNLPTGWSLARADAAISAGSPRLRPRILSPVGHCMYIRRSALELVGDLDADFSQRCLRSGLCHVLADDLLVPRCGGAGAASGRPAPSDTAGPLERSLGAARRALDGLSVVIDARILAGPMTGTQIHVLELVAALARTGPARIRALVPAHPGDHVRELLESLSNVELVAVDGGVRPLPIRAGDVVHRPFQVSSEHDLTLLTRLGGRLIITHQDLIGYRNPSYAASAEDWQRYRHLTRRALALADHTVFFSANARADAIAEDLVEPHRASVVPIGVDHALAHPAAEPIRPPGVPASLADAELIVCIGTNLRHKNRMFALRLLDELRRRHGWGGWLALAGPHLQHGSSARDERDLLARSPQLRERVVDFGAIEEAEKAWLLTHASLVVYPSVYEGFGLVPFEAAQHGVPCLWAAGTALSELLPDAAAGIVPWDVAASAERALDLLRDDTARERNIATVRADAAALTWDAAAAQLLELYREVCDGPPSPIGALERREGLMHAGVSADALQLVGPGGVLPRDLERPLLALATHPQLGAPVFRAIKAGYRASHRWRGWLR